MKKHYKSLATGLRGAALAVILCSSTTAVHAGLLETQSNPVQSTFNPYNLGSWTGLPQYPTEPTGDATAEGYDWSYTQVAHNEDWFYIHYHNSHPFAGDRQLMYFDTDTNRTTGLPGFGGNLAVGAEYFLSGAALNNSSGSFLSWIGWNNTQDGLGEWDIFVAVDRNLMPGVTNFAFVNQNHGSGTDDWYPNAGNDGAGGDYFQYAAPLPAQGTVAFSGRTWTTVNRTTAPAANGGQYDPPQSNSFTTPNANTGLMTGRFGVDTAMTTPVSINLGDTVEYDFFVTSETRNFSGNNADTWFGDTGTGFQNGAGGWATDRNLRFNDSRFEDYFVSPTGVTDKYVNQTRGATQATHVKWVFTSLTTATVTLTLAGDTIPYATFTNTVSNIGDITKFRVGLYDSEQDVTLANFTITPAITPPPAVLVFSGRSWTPLIQEASGQYSPPQTNHYAASNPNTGVMTGRFGVDTALTTPLTLAVGDKITYDYFLTEESRNLRGTGASTYVGDSRTGFQDGSGNWVSGRVATYSSRWDQLFEGNAPQTVSHARGYPWSIHVEWVFTSATTATVTLTLGGETTPFAVWNDTFSDIANIAQFRVGLWDSEQDVVLANFAVLPRIGSLTVEHLWHVGEDGLVLPTDSVGGKPFTGGFGTRTVDSASFAPGSTASLKFANADGGNYMNSLSDAILVPAENWVFEMWANPTIADFGGGVSIATLGSDSGTAQIGTVGGNWYFGEMNVTYGVNSAPVIAGAWTHLAWVRDTGTNRFFVDGTEIGSNIDTLVNNGRIHLFIKPGSGEVPQGNADEIRFSTFTAGQFDPNDLLFDAVPVATNHAAIVLWDNPAAFWRLGEASGATADDLVGGHDGSYAGTLTYGVAGALPGDPDPAVEFDGSSGYVAVTFAAALNSQGPFSVEAWVRPNMIPDSGGTPCPISSAQMTGNRSGWQIRERDTGWQFVLYNHIGSSVANDGLANTAHGGVPSTNSWTHLVGVYDGITTTLYVNGVAYSSPASGYVANYNDGVNPAGPFTIGARSSLDNNFSGRVDEAAFYNHALSATEVLSHYSDRPALTLNRSGGNVILTWPVGTLQQADDVNGAYTDLPSATSPYPTPATTTKKFYRLKL